MVQQAIMKLFTDLRSFAIQGYTFLVNSIKSFKVKMCGTRILENEWALRKEHKRIDWGYDKSDWIRDYWNSITHAHRELLIDRISGYYPFTSVLEIGSNCGPNLLLLSRKFPDVTFLGIDINPIAIKKGKEWLEEENIHNVTLSEGRADNLEAFKDHSIDIIFTDAVLIYVGPDKLSDVMKEMLRIVRKRIVLLEWQNFDQVGQPDNYFDGQHWIRDYARILRDFVPAQSIRITKIPHNAWPDKNWQTYGAIIEIIVS